MKRIHTRRARSTALALAGLVALAGCSGAKKGAAIGGAVGAASGAILGNQSGRTGTGAVAGAAVGAAAGAIIGDYMEKQKKELEQVPGAEVVREGNELRVKFRDAILFEFDSYALKPDALTNLRDIAEVLVKYPDTILVVAGHTDNKGRESYNEDLSLRRARAVRDYLVANGVVSNRLESAGYGETRPVSTNETQEGRAANRRVEIQIAANSELQQKAEQQAQSEAKR